MAICSVVAPAPQPEPASCLGNAMRDVSFLGSDSRYRYTEVFGFGAEGQGFVVEIDF